MGSWALKTDSSAENSTSITILFINSIGEKVIHYSGSGTHHPLLSGSSWCASCGSSWSWSTEVECRVEQLQVIWMLTCLICHYLNNLKSSNKLLSRVNGKYSAEHTHQFKIRPWSIYCSCCLIDHLIDPCLLNLSKKFLHWA